MYINITHIKGISERHKEQLQDAGIICLDDLIEATKPENLPEAIRRSGVWRPAMLGYGVLARAIAHAEKEFYKRVSGGYLLFVEDDSADEPPDGAESGGQLFRRVYGFQVVGDPDRERLFTRKTNYSEEASGSGIFVPPNQWIR